MPFRGTCTSMELYRRGRKLLWHTFHNWNTQSFTRWNKISFWSKFLYPTFIEKTFITRATGVQPGREINRIHPPDTGKYYQTTLRLIKCCRPNTNVSLAFGVGLTLMERFEIEENATRWNYSPLFSVYTKQIGNII